MHVYNAFAPARICALSTARDVDKKFSHRVLTLPFCAPGARSNYAGAIKSLWPVECV